MRDGYLHNLFGITVPAMITTFHQNIGSVLGLASFSAIGFAAKQWRVAVFIGLPLIFLFLLHIAARTTMVAARTTMVARVCCRRHHRARLYFHIGESANTAVAPGNGSLGVEPEVQPGRPKRSVLLWRRSSPSNSRVRSKPSLSSLMRARIDVETDNRCSRACRSRSHGQPHIAETNDRNHSPM
jgi:hypothetical protein